MDDHSKLVAHLRHYRARPGKAEYLQAELLYRCADIIEHQAAELARMESAFRMIEELRQEQYERCGEAQQKAVTLQVRLAEAEAECARIHRARS